MINKSNTKTARNAVTDKLKQTIYKCFFKNVNQKGEITQSETIVDKPL